MQALIDDVAAQPEALLDAPGDPPVHMSGSSFGGGAIQFVAAAIEPRLDAIVPNVACHSLVVAGGQSTPIPVVLDGRSRTVTLKLEAPALRARPSSDLRVQIVPSSPIYGSALSVGTLRVRSLTARCRSSTRPAPGDRPHPECRLTSARLTELTIDKRARGIRLHLRAGRARARARAMTCQDRAYHRAAGV